MAKGYTQMEGINYIDTFSLVAKITIVRLLLALAVMNNWYLNHLIIDSIFKTMFQSVWSHHAKREHKSIDGSQPKTNEGKKNRLVGSDTSSKKDNHLINSLFLPIIYFFS